MNNKQHTLCMKSIKNICRPSFDGTRTEVSLTLGGLLVYDDTAAMGIEQEPPAQHITPPDVFLCSFDVC